MGLSTACPVVCRATAPLDRTATGAPGRGRSSPADVYLRSHQKASAAGVCRAARPLIPSCRPSWPCRLTRQCTQSAVTLGIVFAFRAYLSQLAVGPDAPRGARLRADSRADAPAASRSLPPLLAARRSRVPELSDGAEMAARKSA